MVKNNLFPGDLNFLADESVVIDDNNRAWQKRGDEWVSYKREPKDAFELWDKYRPITLAWER